MKIDTTIDESQEADVDQYISFGDVLVDKEKPIDESEKADVGQHISVGGVLVDKEKPPIMPYSQGIGLLSFFQNL